MQEFYCKYVVKGTFIWRGYDDREITPHSDDFTSSCLIAPTDASTNLHMETIDELLKVALLRLFVVSDTLWIFLSL